MGRYVNLRIVSVLLSLACLTGCGSGDESRRDTRGENSASSVQQQESTAPQAHAPGTSKGQKTAESTREPEAFEPYQAPEFADSVFHADLAEGDGKVLLDLSNVSKGYGGLSVEADEGAKVRLRVTTDDENDPDYVYVVPTDGTPILFPLSCGDAHYIFFVGENIGGTRYAQLYNREIDVKMEDEFQPFLRPSLYVDYDEDSACVRKAAELAQKAETALDVVEQVYQYVCDNIVYDRVTAEKIKAKETTNYIPDLDRVMSTGKGICFDYAALTAAMLRSQGIPVKMVFGDVSPDNVFHAWNMFYTEQTGWVSVHFQVNPKEWNRLDLTFSAGGQNSEFIGDGKNYLDIYYY